MGNVSGFQCVYCGEDRPRAKCPAHGGDGECWAPGVVSVEGRRFHGSPVAAAAFVARRGLGERVVVS